MGTFSISLLDLLKSVLSNRELFFSLVKRDVKLKYKGSILGGVWAIFVPIFMLTVYTFVFSIVFRAKWNGLETGSKATFALILFAGLIIFNFFAECMGNAPSIILNNSSYVKKVVFPLELLPAVSVFSALFNLILSTLVWILFYSLEIGIPNITILFLPLAILPIILMSLGVSWFLSALGVYIRDVGQIVGIVITILMFVSPIFFPINALPVEFRGYLQFNPLASSISFMRDILFWGKLPSLSSYILYLFECFICTFLGYAFFQKTRKGFSDVL